MTGVRRIICVLVAAAMLCPTFAFAQDLSEDEVRRYRELGIESARLYDEGRYEESIARLLEARKIYPHRDIDYNIGRAQAQLGQCEAARGTFRDFIDREDVNDAERAKAKRQLAALERCRERASVTFECTPESAGVFVDEVDRVPCGAAITLREGPHSAEISAQGYVLERIEFDLEPGEELTYPVQLERVAEAPSGKANWQQPVAYAALFGGLASLTAGLLLDASSRTREQNLRNPADALEFEELRRVGQRNKTWTLIFYLAGLAGVGTGITLFAVDVDPQQPESAQWRFGVSPTGVWTTLRW